MTPLPGPSDVPRPALRGAPYGVGSRVWVGRSGMSPVLAEVMEFDDRRPHLVKVKYLHSKTAARIARSRIVGPEGPTS